MVTTGRMVYGQVPNPRRRRGTRRPWRTAALVVAALAVLLLSAGWVEHNWSSFDSRTDKTLCRLMDGRC